MSGGLDSRWLVDRSKAMIGHRGYDDFLSPEDVNGAIRFSEKVWKDAHHRNLKATSDALQWALTLAFGSPLPASHWVEGGPATRVLESAADIAATAETMPTLGLSLFGGQYEPETGPESSHSLRFIVAQGLCGQCWTAPHAGFAFAVTDFAFTSEEAPRGPRYSGFPVCAECAGGIAKDSGNALESMRCSRCRSLAPTFSCQHGRCEHCSYTCCQSVTAPDFWVKDHHNMEAFLKSREWGGGQSDPTVFYRMRNEADAPPGTRHRDLASQALQTGRFPCVPDDLRFVPYGPEDKPVAIDTKIRSMDPARAAAFQALIVRLAAGG